jgi:hypothetical protein
MSVETVAEDIWGFAALDGGSISLWRYIKLSTYCPEIAPEPLWESVEEIQEGFVWLQEQGQGTFWRDEVGEITGVFVGAGHAERARAHRQRAVAQWLAQVENDQ